MNAESNMYMITGFDLTSTGDGADMSGLPDLRYSSSPAQNTRSTTGGDGACGVSSGSNEICTT